MKSFMRVTVLTVLLSGLCASAQTNTTGASTDSVTSPANAAPQPESVAAAPIAPSIRMALLLPLDSPTLASAAEAVRAGFLAARERDGAAVQVRIFTSGEKPQDVLQAYADAAYEYDLVVGPLSRDDVAAVAQSDKISKPTIALAQPDWSSDREIILPQKMLMMGLSLEDEARQIAIWSSTGKKTGQAFIVSTNTSWQRRTAAAFAEEWQKHGLAQQSIDLPAVEGYLGASNLIQLKERIQTEKPAVVFLALDAQQALEVRKIVGNDVPMYGTSQINAVPLADRRIGEPTPEMNGVRLVDIPWQLQADDLAVMSYPRLSLNQNQKRRADLERLYALGIDAYRVAKEIAMHNTKFALDGVTGALTVSFGNGMPSFKRVEPQAIYRQGHLVPLTPSK